MTTAIYGTVRNIKNYPSSGNCIIEVEIPVEHFKKSAVFFEATVLVTRAVLDAPFGVHESGAAMGEEPAKEPATKLVSTDIEPRHPLAVEERQPAKEPAKAKFPAGLCGLAVRWCADDHFQRWLNQNFPETWAEYSDGGKDLKNTAKCVVCDVCEVDSRKLLDEVEEAGELFKREILDPYREHRAAEGLDGV